VAVHWPCCLCGPAWQGVGSKLALAGGSDRQSAAQKRSTRWLGVPGVLNWPNDIAAEAVIFGQQVFIDMHMVVAANDLPTAHRGSTNWSKSAPGRLAYGPVRWAPFHLDPGNNASAEIKPSVAHG